MRIRLVVGVLALAVLATACPSEPTPIANCDLGGHPESVPVLTRDSPSQRHTLAVLHPGIGSGAEDSALELVDKAVASGTQLTIWTLRSSQASGMERLIDADFAGTSQTDDGIRFELRRPRADALCAVLAATGQQPLDDGADLLGAVERLINEAGSSGSETELVLVTGGGVHRTNELDLGDQSVIPASFEPRIERIRAALQGSSNLPATVEVIGVGTFEGVASPPTRDVADLATRLWTDVCAVVSQEGVPCSPTP